MEEVVVTQDDSLTVVYTSNGRVTIGKWVVTVNSTLTITLHSH